MTESRPTALKVT